MSTFPIYQLEDFDQLNPETMGTKARRWYAVTDKVPNLHKSTQWLFKTPNRRAFRGEIWAEKLTAELGFLMKLPIARVELAQLKEDQITTMGTICLNFAERRDKELEHGNELMEAQALQGEYERDKEGQLKLDAVYDYLRQQNILAPLQAQPYEQNAEFFFTGYLVFDALIGNVDRHHQNWGVVRTADGARHLAPTFDHGASLGRELQPDKRAVYLQGMPILIEQRIKQYATNRYASAKIAPPGLNDRNAPFKVLDFLPELGQTKALCFWLEKALSIRDTQLASLFNQLPTGIADSTTQQFAQAFMNFTQKQLEQLRKEIC